MRSAVQVPFEAGRSHASHWPAQTRLQHTPSMQRPDAHWPSFAQLSARGSRVTQTFAEQ